MNYSQACNTITHAFTNKHAINDIGQCHVSV